MKKILLLLTLFLSAQFGQAQVKKTTDGNDAPFYFQTAKKNKNYFTNYKGSNYEFYMIRHIDATPVKNQNRTGTCWSFSGLSFFESELLRMGKPAFNLSEMWIARNAYIGKAQNYLLMDVHLNFGQGGEFHDIPWVVNHYGMVPEYAYQGKAYGGDKHNHNELKAVLTAMLKALKDKPQNGKLTASWKKAYTNVLDAYLGNVPDNTEDFTFNYDDKTFTPKSFAKYLELNMDDYVELTSFTHHPYYKAFAMEIPDNWQMHTTYNIPLDELMEISENAIRKGYSFAWGADVSEKGFSHRKGLAILPKDERTVQDKRTASKYFDEDDKQISNAFFKPVKEKIVPPAERQKAFENGETTDDHGMHIVGMVRDQAGTKYFIVKNSWGESNELNGHFLVSFPYFKYKTIDIFVHKDALPKSLKKKLHIE